jgi:hypothetical protein
VDGGRRWTRTSGLLHVKHFRLSAVLGAWRYRAKVHQLCGHGNRALGWSPCIGLVLRRDANHGRQDSPVTSSWPGVTSRLRLRFIVRSREVVEGGGGQARPPPGGTEEGGPAARLLARGLPVRGCAQGPTWRRYLVLRPRSSGALRSTVPSLDSYTEGHQSNDRQVCGRRSCSGKQASTISRGTGRPATPCDSTVARCLHPTRTRREVLSVSRPAPRLRRRSCVHG